MSLVLEFEGWCSLRLPTDPDPSDEPRGISGYTFAFAGEPDFDRVLNLQPRPGMPIRSHSPELGVKVTRASGDRPFEGRARRPARRADHREPQLDADAAGLRADRAVPPAGRGRRRVARARRPAEPRRSRRQPLWQVPQALLEAQGAQGMEYEPATVGDATGEWDPLGAVQARLAALERDLAKRARRGGADRARGPDRRADVRGRQPRATAACWCATSSSASASTMVGDATATGDRRGRHERALADRLLARRVGSRPAVPLHERGTERSVCRCWPVEHHRIARSGRPIRCRSSTPSRSTSSG